MTADILLTGGTGTLGRLVTPRLRATGCRIRVLSRRPRESLDGLEFAIGDLDTGVGLDEATAGVRTVVHLAGSAKGDETKARHLTAAASRAGVQHIVNISVVGADRIPVASAADRSMFGYFAAQGAAEQVIASSGIPWTSLRATQFHDLILAVARTLAKLPVVPVPAGFRFQPVDADEVAARLVELALAEPAGVAPDIGGPRVYEVAELVRAYLRAAGRRRAILPVKLPGVAARALRHGANLTPDHGVGRRSWEDFLAARVGRTTDNAAGAH